MFILVKDNIIFATMKIKNIVDLLEEWSPSIYAEEYDNVGLIVGDLENNCKGILITLDALENVIDECIKKKYNLIISFPPIVFSGLKKFNNNSYVTKSVSKAIKNDISIFSLHTSLDNFRYGVSHCLAKSLDLNSNEVLIPKENTINKLITYVPKKNAPQLLSELFRNGAGDIGNYNECSFSTNGLGTFKGNKKSTPNFGEKEKRVEIDEVQLNLIFKIHQKNNVLKTLFKFHPYEEVPYELISISNKNQDIGMGSVGYLKVPLDENTFLRLIQKKLKIPIIRHSKKIGRKIKKVAVLGGSGSFAINDAKKSKADAYITSDLKYHNYFEAENDILLIDAGHYETEQFTKKLIHDYLREKLPNFAIALSKSETNPVKYFLNGKKE